MLLFSTKHLDELLVQVQRLWLRMMRFEYTIPHMHGIDFIIADTLENPGFRIYTAWWFTPRNRSLRQIDCAELACDWGALREDQKFPENIWSLQIDYYLSKFRMARPDKGTVPVIVKPYLPMRDDFSIQCGLLIRGSHIFIPPTLHKEMLNWLHISHQDITKCLEKARQSVW